MLYISVPSVFQQSFRRHLLVLLRQVETNRLGSRHIQRSRRWTGESELSALLSFVFYHTSINTGCSNLVGSRYFCSVRALITTGSGVILRDDNLGELSNL